MIIPDVKVYTASVQCLEDPELFQAWLERVPEVRRKKAEELRNPQGRRQSLGASSLLVCALEDAVGAKMSAADIRGIRIAESEWGKPYLPDYPHVHFSLSHSGEQVMCAVSGTPVGCDVEETGDAEADRRRIAMVAKCLTEQERRRSLEDPAAFYRIWTLKESFLKLTGKGLTLALNSFEADPDMPQIRQEILAQKVECRLYGPRGGYQFACATQSGRIAEEMIRVDLKEALETGSGRI